MRFHEDTADSGQGLPISVVIPTADRPRLLGRSLETIFSQDVGVKEIVVVDASDSLETLGLFQSFNGAPTVSPNGLSWELRGTRVIYRRASSRGAARQRNQGIEVVSQPFILFMDDDVELQEGCLAKLWSAMISDERIGGVSSMILNQKYNSPGSASRILYFLVSGEKSETFAGRCLGPVLALLPEDRDELPEVVPVEWLNTTCTLYRREALPMPVFPSHFTGYSMAEDINLSLTVGKAWKLVNARTGRIFHNSGPGPYKPTGAALAKMSLINRHYIMTRTLGRTTLLDYAKLVLVEAFGIVTSLRYGRAWAELPAILAGKVQAILAIAMGR